MCGIPVGTPRCGMPVAPPRHTSGATAGKPARRMSMSCGIEGRITPPPPLPSWPIGRRICAASCAGPHALSPPTLQCDRLPMPLPYVPPPMTFSNGPPSPPQRVWRDAILSGPLRRWALPLLGPLCKWPLPMSWPPLFGAFFIFFVLLDVVCTAAIILLVVGFFRLPCSAAGALLPTISPSLVVLWHCGSRP